PPSPRPLLPGARRGGDSGHDPPARPFHCPRTSARALGAERGMSVAPSSARPGPGPIPDRLLKALDVTIGRRMQGMLAGDYRSAQLGDGKELALNRPYTPGDDVRRIDWNVTARTGEPHVRVHQAERVLVTWLLLDSSASMGFGPADRRKADVAEGVAIAVGHLSTRRGNRLGALTFGGADPKVL